MKKVILVLSVISLFVACGSPKTKEVKCDSTCVKADSCKVDSSKKAK